MLPKPITSNLPALTADEAAHAEAVHRHIAARIARAGGFISFAEFMELALYAPGLGYYSAGAVKFGAAGDFVTAPEVSDLFAQAIARQMADVLGATGGEVLELGAGSGRFAAAALERLAQLDALPGRYYILEVSADLRERQRAYLISRLGAAADRVHWLERLPERFAGVIFANEVLDALPCERFVLRAGAPWQLGVALERGALSLRQRLPDTALAAEIARVLGARRAELPDGYTSELCPRADAWIAALAAALEHGLVMLIDYGLPRAQYYHPQRVTGSFRCYFRHRAHDDALLYPGLTDWSAWVDFTRIAEAATANGLRVAGFTTQAGLLLGCGIDSLLASAEAGPMPNTSPGTSPGAASRQVQLAREARRLMMPGEMGEAMKAIALTRDLPRALRGFGFQDLLGTL